MVIGVLYYGWPLIAQFLEAITPDDEGCIGGILKSCTNYCN